MVRARMQVRCIHNDVRYPCVPAEGPTGLFEWGGKDLRCAGILTIDEVRPAIGGFEKPAGALDDRGDWSNARGRRATQCRFAPHLPPR